MSEESTEKVVWGDIDEMPRDQCLAAFRESRERIFCLLIEIDTSIRHVNLHRFADYPIVLDFDFERQLNHLNLLPQSEQTHVRNLANERLNMWREEGLL